jgi:A/G-specific adenine glycosylase
VPIEPHLGQAAQAIVDAYRRQRRDLPWRRSTDAYAIWVSEIMLQQTRVATVIPYFERWLARFPTVVELAAAALDDVLAAWSGLGYYSRARNLHRGAAEVVARYGGKVPDEVAALRTLPGVGRYTAGAIASIAFGRREPVVDGNVMRVLARLYAIEDNIKAASTQKRLWDLAAQMVPEAAPGDFNQGIMELGATVCTPSRPTCPACPLAALCRARAEGREGVLPVMPRRKSAHELPLLDRAAAWIERRGKLLLVRRRAEGLYGGMWELPQAGGPQALSAAVGVEVQLRAQLPDYTHSQRLSHRRLRIRVWRARLGGGRVRPDPHIYEGFRWQPLARLAERGLASGTAEIAKALLADSQQQQSSSRPRSPLPI